MGAHGDVGAFARRDLLDEVILDVSRVLADELDCHAGLLLVRVGGTLEGVHALGVDPHREGRRGLGLLVSRVVGGSVAGSAGATGQAERARDRDGRECPARLVHRHRCSLSFVPATPPDCKRLHGA